MKNTNFYIKGLLYSNYFFLALFIFSFYFANPSLSEIVYLYKAPFFSDFYDLLNNYLGGKTHLDTYNPRTFYLIFSIIPESLLPSYFDNSSSIQNYKEYYEEYIFSNLYFYIIFMVVSLSLFFHSFYLHIRRYINNLSVEMKITILLAIIFSYPMFYGFLRGNNIILAVAFLNYFLFFRQKPFISSIFGILAISIKIYFAPLIIFFIIKNLKFSYIFGFFFLLAIYFTFNQYDIVSLFDSNLLYEKAISYWKNYSHIERYNYNISFDTFFHFIKFTTMNIVGEEVSSILFTHVTLLIWRFVLIFYILFRINKIFKFFKEENDYILISILYFIFLIVFSPFTPMYFLIPLVVFFFILIERYEFNKYIITLMIIACSFKRFLVYPYPYSRYDFLSLDGAITSVTLILIFIYLIEKIICGNLIKKVDHSIGK